MLLLASATTSVTASSSEAWLRAPISAKIPSTWSTCVPLRWYTTGFRLVRSGTICASPSDALHLRAAAKHADQDHLHLGIAVQHGKGRAIVAGRMRAGAAIEETSRPPAKLLDHVHRRHGHAGAAGYQATSPSSRTYMCCISGSPGPAAAGAAVRLLHHPMSCCGNAPTRRAPPWRQVPSVPLPPAPPAD